MYRGVLYIPICVRPAGGGHVVGQVRQLLTPLAVCLSASADGIGIFFLEIMPIGTQFTVEIAMDVMVGMLVSKDCGSTS